MAAPVSKPGRAKNFTARIPPVLLEEFTLIAKRRGIPRHDLLVAILREWVRANGAEDR
jgi:hypothetical protein